jgi:hypothetical protein
MPMTLSPYGRNIPQKSKNYWFDFDIQPNCIIFVSKNQDEKISQHHIESRFLARFGGSYSLLDVSGL